MKFTRTFPLFSLAVTLLTAWLLLWVSSCSSDRFLADDELLLQSVKMETDSKRINLGEYRVNVRQEANSRWFSTIKVPLGIYCLQGRDSTRRFNRFIRKIGEAPVVYDASLTAFSERALGAAMSNQGYLHSHVTVSEHVKGKHVKVKYKLEPGVRSYVGDIHYLFDNADIRDVVMADKHRSKLKKGSPLNMSLLSEERSRIVSLLRDRGYYNIHNEYVTFRADTAENDYGVNLTLRMGIPPGVDSTTAYSIYQLGDVNVREDAQQMGDTLTTISAEGLRLHYSTKRNRLHRRIYDARVALRKDSVYSAALVSDTYRALNNLPAVSLSSVHLAARPDTTLIDADVNVMLSEPNTISAELEGTNTSGDLGAALALTFSNNNVFRGAENLSLKLRGAYEAIKGLEGYQNQDYVEYSADLTLRFPSLLLPFTNQRTRVNTHGKTELGFTYNSQNRPEFHRRVLTGTWAYRWNNRSNQRWSHRVDLLSLNYVSMPWISETFRNDYLEGNDVHYAVLRYTYEDLFIMRMGYSFTYTSAPQSANGLYKTNGHQIRFNVETAGNVLDGLSHLFTNKHDESGQRRVFGIAYSQYAKVDFDFVKSLAIDDVNSLAFHAAFGIAIPYGNASVIPYEKRYFAGGANSIRGWSVRRLGPGSYVGTDGKINFINQTGNLKLEFSAEYRTHLFWKFDGAAFVDAGNVWNTRNYADQSGGQFRFSRFYKEIAVAYGLGLRFNFDYFILRFDGGMKAIDPAYPSGRDHYPLLHPRFSRDFTFHFAVGLPF